MLQLSLSETCLQHCRATDDGSSCSGVSRSLSMLRREMLT